MKRVIKLVIHSVIVILVAGVTVKINEYYQDQS